MSGNGPSSPFVEAVLSIKPLPVGGEDSWDPSYALGYNDCLEAVHTCLSATPGALVNLIQEVHALRDVLVFADGRSVTFGYALADLYAADANAQGVLERAGCHPRTAGNAGAEAGR